MTNFICYAEVIEGFGMGFGQETIGVVEAKNERSAKAQARKIAKEDGIYECSIDVEKATEHHLRRYKVRKPKTKGYFMDILKDVIDENGDTFNLKRAITPREEEALIQVFKHGKFTIKGLRLAHSCFGWGVEDVPDSGKFLMCDIVLR